MCGRLFHIVISILLPCFYSEGDVCPIIPPRHIDAALKLWNFLRIDDVVEKVRKRLSKYKGFSVVKVD